LRNPHRSSNPFFTLAGKPPCPFSGHHTRRSRSWVAIAASRFA
jgi:hypothetical protein